MNKLIKRDWKWLRGRKYRWIRSLRRGGVGLNLKNSSKVYLWHIWRGKRGRNRGFKLKEFGWRV